MSQDPRKRVLFYRNYQGFQGGHLKVWDYFQHTLCSRTHQPFIHFSSDSLWDSSNPWANCEKDRLVTHWDPQEADVLFLAGLDWQALSTIDMSIPIINLIQGIRHADERDPRRKYLLRKAYRICVSQEVCAALVGTGIVNGPIAIIPNGISLPTSPQDVNNQTKDIGILISGMKNPHFAKQLAKELKEKGFTAEVELNRAPRDQYLEKLSRAQIAVLLPLEKEGFFLPALEAMALGCLVICPDCIGNRSFCIDGVNAFRPNYCVEAIISSIIQAIKLEADKRIDYLKEARITAEKHSLIRERLKFHEILANLDSNKTLIRP
jgi:hypothetical protein